MAFFRRRSRFSLSGSATSTSTASTSSTGAATTANNKEELIRLLEGTDAEVVKDTLKRKPFFLQKKYRSGSGTECRMNLLTYSVFRGAIRGIVEVIYQAKPEALVEIDEEHKSVFHVAAIRSTEPDVMLFLMERLQQDFQTNIDSLLAPGGWNPLHFACSYCVVPLKTMQVMVTQCPKAVKQRTSPKKSTPLHLLLDHGKDDTYVFAATRGLVYLDPSAPIRRNQDGKTPVDIAKIRVQNTKMDPNIARFLASAQDLLLRTYTSRASIEERVTKVTAQLAKLKSVKEEINSTGSVSNSDSSLASFAELAGGYEGIRMSIILAEVELKILEPMKGRIKSYDELKQDMKVLREAKNSYMEANELGKIRECDEKIKQLEKLMVQETTNSVSIEISNSRKKLSFRMSQDTTEPVEISTAYIDYCTDGQANDARIGRGGFGDVYLGFDKDLSLQFAVKTCLKFNDKSLQNEVEVLSKTAHPNIVRLFATARREGSISPTYLVLEYAPGGTLSDILSNETGRSNFTWALRTSAAEGIASAVAFLHDRGIGKIVPKTPIPVALVLTPAVHHDLKPGNIVFSDDLKRAILIDCGISKVDMDPELTKGQVIGTPAYLPPEYKGDTEYGEKQEVFTLGLVLRDIYTGLRIRCYEDRQKPLEADPLAGHADQSVLDAFRDIIYRSTSNNPDDRQRSADVAKALESLQQLLDDTTVIDEATKVRVDAEMERSTLASRPTLSLSDQGYCRCSPNTLKKGLFCPASDPSKRHFHCAGCLNKQVTDYLGEEICCHHKGCKSVPFTLAEMLDHLRKDILCRHVDAQLRNQQIAAMKPILELKEELKQEIRLGIDRVMKGITALGRDELKCPLLAILVPVRSESRVKMRSFLSNWTNATQKTFNVYFLCAHDYSLVPSPVRITAPREWVQRAAPFFRVVLAGLAVAVGIEFGRLPNLRFLGGDQESQAIKLKQMDEMLVAAGGGERALDQKTFEDGFSYQNLMGKISPESYKMVCDHATQLGNLSWKNHMDLVERKGELAWVRKKNLDAYLLNA